MAGDADVMSGGVPQGSPGRRDRYREALQRLRGAQKSSKGAPPYSRLVNRPLGRRLAAGSYVVGLTPDQVTLVSAVFSLTGIALVATVAPVWWLGPVVAALLVIGYALDSADGQLARLRGGGSPQGEWLDHVADAAKLAALHLAVLIAWYRFYDLEPALLLIPVGYVLVETVTFSAIILKDVLAEREAIRSGVRPAAGAAPGPLRSVLLLPTDYGILCLVFLLLGAPTLFFVAYTLMFVCFGAYGAVGLVKWYRDVRALRA